MAISPHPPAQQGDPSITTRSKSLIDAPQQISPALSCVLWLDTGEKSGSTSSGSPAGSSSSIEDDVVHPAGNKDEGSSWTTATVQSTLVAEPVVPGSSDSFSMTSTTSEMEFGQSETMLPIDSFLTPASSSSSSICSQQDYEILKASPVYYFFLFHISWSLISCSKIRYDVDDDIF